MVLRDFLGDPVPLLIPFLEDPTLSNPTYFLYCPPFTLVSFWFLGQTHDIFATSIF